MISYRSLPVRGARYHWRQNLPVALGVAVSAAVLTGALIVGDSLRGSLRDRAERQLNGVEAAYVGPRLVREEVANDLGGGVLPAMILQGSVRTTGSEPTAVPRVTIVGVPAGDGLDRFRLPNLRGAVVSSRLADRLGVQPGDTIDLGVEKMSAVPRSSLLGRRGVEDVTTSVRAEVTAVLPDDHPANDFNLTPDPSVPLNVYVPLNLLQEKLGKPDRVNALLGYRRPAAELNAALADKLTLDDWGLRVEVAPNRKAYVSVESEQLILDPPTVKAVEAAAASIGARSERTMAYMANAISAGTKPVWNNEPARGVKLIPYSVVAALDPSAAPPLGPFLPPGAESLADDEIVLADWPDSPLKNLKPGDPVTLTYFKPEMEAGFEEAFAVFRLKGFVPLEGPAEDPNLTPPYPGITDQLTIDRWDAPFPLNRQRIRSGDVNERYWNRYRTTPKAYITRTKGEQLFGSRFGTVTSIRVAPPPGTTPAGAAEKLRTAIRQKLDPAAAGLQFEPTRERMLAASVGGTDFAALLLMFSWLLILTALLLVGLLFRLAMERRAKEVGLFLATGYTPGQVRRLLLLEGLAVAAVGSLVGIVAAVGYAHLMIRVLTGLWPNPEVAGFLRVHVTPVSLVAGFIGTVLLAVLTIWLRVRGLVRVSPPALLRGETARAEDVAVPDGFPWVSLVSGIVIALVGVGLLFSGRSRANPDERSIIFFTGGGFLLAAGLLLARVVFRRPPRGTISSRGTAGLAALGDRNIRRNSGRSLLTAALIAFAGFLIVSVESFRRRTDEDFLTKTGGSGGFRLVAEADVPVFQPFDREPGRSDVVDRLQAEWGVPSTDPRLDEAERLLSSATVVPFRLQGGDDASCLNLYQAGRPRVLGVPEQLIDRGGFRFAETEAATEEEKANPWLLLRKEYPPIPPKDGKPELRVVPVFAEQYTAMYMLKRNVGEVYVTTDESGTPYAARIVGTLQDSVFQSELLMSDDNFRRLYPRQEGFRVFLIDVPAGQETAVRDLLESGLRSNGMVVEQTVDRVATYQRVIGAYLTTFQLLGGFALLLAVLGTGVVVLRSVWERTGELALLRAVGYPSGALQTMILTETLLVLLIGLGVGIAAAIASVLPNLALGGSVPWANLVGLLAAVAGAGTAVAILATVGVARAPLIPSLRKD